MTRSVVHYALLPLALIACALAGAPWLRAYPADTLAAPLFGAAVLSVLVPVVVIGIGVRALWQTILIDLVVFVFFAMLVALHEPLGFADLYAGIAHGPAQILTFALPLVSPRTLLVAPVTLCWISGAIVGECVGRAWHSVVPYATLLVVFGLAYAGSARAISSASDGRRYDTVFAASLLLALLIMRAAQAWIEQDLDAEATQPDGVLPLRGVALGVLAAVVVTAGASAVVQANAFTGPPTSPARVAPLDQLAPLSPVSFVAGLRPDDPAAAGRELFAVTVDRRTSGYIGIADVDTYDGDGWSFERTFRPSGGVVPAESDPSLRAPGPPVQQRYTIAPGALSSAPWMPFLYRPERISGLSVNTDSPSGMVVPSRPLASGERYTVTSSATPGDFDALRATPQIATSAPSTYTFVPPSVSTSLGAVVTSFENETGSSASSPGRFLQAVAADLRDHYSLTGPRSASSAVSTSPAPTPTATDARSGARAGGTGFADVLASILGATRSATPEQYATLVALVARQLGMPSRVVSGFRVTRPGHTSATIPAGTYDVTTAEAWTWVEIPVQGRGWMVLDAAPDTYGGQRQQQSVAARPTSSPTPTLTPRGLLTQSNRDGHAVADPSNVAGSGHVGRAAAVLLVVAGLVLFALLVLLGLVLRKRRRLHRRQRVVDPRLRLIGAWQESLDVLAEAGAPDLRNLTGSEVAVTAGRYFGDGTAAQVRYLGDAANAAIFSPASPVEPGEADEAWRAELLLRRTVRNSLSRREQVGASLRYHRPHGRPVLRRGAAPRSRHRVH